jgi:hypothetical protein
MGYLAGYWPWYLWAAFLLLFAPRHPSIFDTSPLGPGRRFLGVLALVIFVLCFMAVPIAVTVS